MKDYTILHILYNWKMHKCTFPKTSWKYTEFCAKGKKRIEKPSFGIIKKLYEMFPDNFF